MIKRSVALLLLLFLLLPPIAAHGDVLIEPNNNFYTQHWSECEYLGRDFYANGEGGSVSLKKEPGSEDEEAAIENGEVLSITFTYNYNGEIWGVAMLSSPDEPYVEWPTGWAPMNQFLLKYDYISFEEEHQDEFYPYTGGYETLKSAEEIIVWSWPGSGDAQETLDIEVDENFSFTHAYKDESGREWGFIAYWYRYRNVWICISDPSDSDIPAFFPPPQPELWQPGDKNGSQGGFSTPIIIVVLVAVVIVCTAVLIRVFWKPNKDNS